MSWAVLSLIRAQGHTGVARTCMAQEVVHTSSGHGAKGLSVQKSGREQFCPATGCVGPESLSKWICTLLLCLCVQGVHCGPLERPAPAAYSGPVSWLHISASGHIHETLPKCEP